MRLTCTVAAGLNTNSEADVGRSEERRSILSPITESFIKLYKPGGPVRNLGGRAARSRLSGLVQSRQLALCRVVPVFETPPQRNRRRGRLSKISAAASARGYSFRSTAVMAAERSPSPRHQRRQWSDVTHPRAGGGGAVE